MKNNVVASTHLSAIIEALSDPIRRTLSLPLLYPALSSSPPPSQAPPSASLHASSTSLLPPSSLPPSSSQERQEIVEALVTIAADLISQEGSWYALIFITFCYAFLLFCFLYL